MKRFFRPISTLTLPMMSGSLAVLCAGLGSVVSPALVPPALSQAIPAAPAELQPRIRIEPDQPLSVVLVNESQQSLEYGLTTSRPQQLAAGAQATHDRVPLPTNGVIYPLVSAADQYAQPAFKFDLSVSSNVLTIKIRPIEDGAEGDSVVRVRRDGSVFVY